jgi:hypothetical protein
MKNIHTAKSATLDVTNGETVVAVLGDDLVDAAGVKEEVGLEGSLPGYATFPGGETGVEVGRHDGLEVVAAQPPVMTSSVVSSTSRARSRLEGVPWARPARTPA